MNFQFCVNNRTISHIVKQFFDAFTNILCPVYLKTPSSVDEQHKIADELDKQCNFPKTISTIDRKHVVIQMQKNGDFYYYKYKHSDSEHLVISLDISGLSYELFYSDVRKNATVNDRAVCNKSKISSLKFHPLSYCQILKGQVDFRLCSQVMVLWLLSLTF